MCTTLHHSQCCSPTNDKQFFTGSLLCVSCKINQKIKLANRKDSIIVFSQDLVLYFCYQDPGIFFLLKVEMLAGVEAGVMGGGDQRLLAQSWVIDLLMMISFSLKVTMCQL